MKNILQKIQYFSYRVRATYQFRNIQELNLKSPLISFSFDDFPMSAAISGADILSKNNIKGTFYISLALLEKESNVGKICDVNSIKNLISNNHEIGSHTYSHANAYNESVEAYEKSIIENEKNFKKLFYSNGFETLSYPFGFVSTDAKRIAQKHFRCARSSYKGINIGRVDLNMLKAYPIYGSSKNLESMKSVIDITVKKKGWLIFYTHDIEEKPSSFGCTPGYFENVVRYAVNSGARLLPVIEAYNLIHSSLKN